MAKEKMADFKKRIKRNQTNRNNHRRRTPLMHNEELFSIVAVARGIVSQYNMVNLDTVRNLRRDFITEQQDEIEMFLVRRFLDKSIVENLSFVEDGD